MSDNPNIVIGVKYDPSGEKQAIAGAQRIAKAFEDSLGAVTGQVQKANAAVSSAMSAATTAANKAQQASQRASKAAQADLNAQMKAADQLAAKLMAANLAAVNAENKRRREAEKAREAKKKAAEKEFNDEFRRMDALAARLAAENNARVALAQKRIEADRKAAQASVAAEEAALAARERLQNRYNAKLARPGENMVSSAMRQQLKLQLANEDQNAALARMMKSLNFASAGGGPGTLQKMFSGAGGMLSSLAGGFGNMFVGAMKGAASAFMNAMQGALSWLSGALQYTVGAILRDVARAFVQSILDGINTAKEAVAGVERTMVSLTTQGRIENTVAGQDPTTALANARKEAAKYLAVVRQLAVFSPFSVEDVQGIYKTFAAYGLGRKEALRLSTGLVDLSAAFMTTGAQAQSAALALAQIISRGKVTGEEIRQLVNSGVLVLPELRKELGLTADEFEKMVKSGEMTTDKVLPALEKVFESYKGAGKDASLQTFNGLLSSLADLGPILLQEFFGPINAQTGEMQGLFGALIPVLRDVVGALTDPNTIRMVRNWGIALGKAAEDAFAWGRNAWNWGYNLMVQYGNGILAAATLVLDAVARVGDAIASWLMPHSPPKILPDIDKWGKETMEVWLAGFTQADANQVFSTLSSELGGLMRSMFKAIGDEDKSVLPGMLRGLNEAIGDLVIAYSGGGSNSLQEAQLRVTSMFAEATPVVRDYIQALLNAQSAATAVSAAQRNLAQITEYYETKLGEIDRQIQSLQNTQKDISDDSEIRKLNLIINSQFVSADRRKQAQARLEELRLTKVKRGLEVERDAKVAAAQAALAAAELEQKKRDEQLAAAKMMLDFYQAQNTLLNEQEEALKRIADALGKLEKLGDGGGGGGGGLQPWTPGKDREANGARSKVEWDPFAGIRQKLEELQAKWEEFKASASAAFQGVKDKWDEISAPLKIGIESVAETFEMTKSRIAQATAETGLNWETFLAGVLAAGAGFTLNMNRDWDNLWITVGSVFSVFLIGASLIWNLFLSWLLGNFRVFDAVFEGDWKRAWSAVGNTFWQFKADLDKAWNELVALFANYITQVFPGFEEGFKTAWEGISTWFSTTVNGMGAGITGFVNTAIGELNKLITAINDVILAYNSIPALPDVPTIPTIAPMTPAGGQVVNNTTINNNLGVTTKATAGQVVQSFNTMKALTAV